MPEVTAMSHVIDPKWEISFPAEHFDRLRCNPQFVATLVLGRMVNALRFCQMAVVAIADYPRTPAFDRQVLASFLFTCGLVVEALDTAKRLSKDLRHLPSFQNWLRPLFRDKTAERLRRGDLNRLREKVVFHFDRNVFELGVATINFPAYIFASIVGRRKGDVYYNLSDEVAVNFILDAQGDDRPEKVRLEELITAVRDLSLQFCDAADSVIAESLTMLGWQGRQLT